jgi:hypothetical protein
MKSLRWSVLMALLLLSQAIAQGQELWTAGYLVNASGDTLHGEVLFSDWSVSPKRIDFKSANGQQSTYPASDVKAFGITELHKTFRSHAVTLDYYTDGVAANVGAAKLKTETTQLFIEVLLASPVLTLYECLDEKGKERFLLEKNGQLTVLRNVVFRVQKDASYYLVKREYYKEELKQLLSECPTLNTTRLKYENKYLIALLKEYHHYCKVDYKVDFEQQNLKPAVSVGVLVGRHFPANLSLVGGSLYIGSRKKFGSIYTVFDVGVTTSKREADPTFGTYAGTFRHAFVSVYVGKYMGLGNWQPFIYTGASTLTGFLDTGVGISYKRMISVSFNGLLQESFELGYGNYRSAQVRLSLPVSKGK